MEIERIRVMEGRNIYSPFPVIEMEVNLGDLEQKTSRDHPCFIEDLLQALPGLREHHCSLGRPGGFVQRLNEGTLFGHIIEHVALELQAAVGADVVYGKTRATQRKAVYRVVYEFTVRDVGTLAGQQAVALVEALWRGQPFDISRVLQKLKNLLAQKSLGPSTAAIVRAAEERGIPFLRLSDESLVQLGYGCRQRRIEASITSLTGVIGVDIAADKALAKKLLAEAGLPVPQGGIAATEEEALALAEEIGYPVVVKPYNGNQGKGVSLNLKCPAEVKEAFKLAQNYAGQVIVEKYIFGRHYRLLVVGNRVVAASERIPARVVGDGESTIAQLVEQVNADPERGEGHEKPLTKIKIDPVVLMVLARQGWRLKDIPERGQIVYLRENANLSTGGTAIDVSDEIHPRNARLALRAAETVGLDVAGVDLVLPHIAEPGDETGGAIIEVNAAPGLRMHLYPTQGQPRPVARAIVDHLFPPGENGRIPLVAVTGTNGKTTTVRMIGRILEKAGFLVGMTTTDGVFLGEEKLLSGDTTGPKSARLLLTHPRVEAAVLETARGGLLRGGLAFDRCDVGVLLNVAEDHLGQDGIEDLEDLVFVKSVILEAIASGGRAVLNADDPNSLLALPRVRVPIIYFSSNSRNLIVHKHLAEGKEAVFLRRGQIIVAKGGEEARVIAVNQIPATFRGAARFNVENALAATAAAWALGLSPDIIAAGLRSFTASSSINPGRFNLWELAGIKIMVDYAHNPPALSAILRTARRLKPARLIGVIASPGDRRDESILRLGEVAGRGFDLVVAKEDEDRRGRPPGEVAALLARGARKYLPPEQVQIILAEEEAVRWALTQARPGDLVAVFYEKYEAIMEILQRLRREMEAVITIPAAEPKEGSTRVPPPLEAVANTPG